MVAKITFHGDYMGSEYQKTTAKSKAKRGAGGHGPKNMAGKRGAKCV
jgi:hypothetical protein